MSSGLSSQFATAAFEDDFAFDQDHVSIRERRHRGEVFVYHDGGDAGGANAFENAPDLAGDQRRQSFGGFVEYR